MRPFKKIQIFLLAVLLLIYSACSSSPATDSTKLNVVATTPILGNVVSVIGGEFIELTVIIPSDTDPHAYEPAPQDAGRLSDADLVFVNGLDLEEALRALLETEGLHLVIASEGISPLEFAGEEFQGADPHVWMNPLNVKIWAENITAALAAADPAHADQYRANAAAYQAELDELEAWAQQQLAQIQVANRQLVTDHESFAYFADRYGFEVIGALIPSLSTVSEPSAGELAQLEDAIEQHGVSAIFISSAMNPALAQRVAADTGVQLVTLYSESLTAADGPAPTYLDLIRFDIEAIVAALK